MARLPTANDLGGIPSGNSRRPIASYDLDPVTTAGQRMGETIARAGAVMGDAIAKAGTATERGLTSLGKGAQDAASGVQTYMQHRDNMAFEQAKADKLTKQAELENEFANDQDYGTLRERYLKRVGEINKEIEGQLGNSGAAERYKMWTAPRDIYSDGSIQARARKLEGDVLTAGVQERLTKLRETGLNDPDPTRRVDVIDTGNGLISSLRQAGHISAVQEQNFKQKWVSDYAKSSVEMMPDTEQVRLLSGNADPMVSLIPADDRVALKRGAQSRIETANNKMAAARSEQYERGIIDGAAGVAPLPDRKALEADPLLTEPRRNTLLRQLDSARGDVAVLQGVAAKYADPNGGAFNPFDKKEVDAIDKIFKFEGGDMPALQKVVDRTGIVPPSVAVRMRGDLASNDPKRVASALQMSTNLLNSNPNVFAATTGKKEFEDAVVAFQHNVNDFGMTAEQAARRHIDEQAPEYQQKIKAKIKSEDVNDIVKKNLSPGDVTGAFDTSWFPGSPKLAFEPETRRSMFGDYEEKFREAYLKNGDVNRSKAIAADLLRKAWGVTKVNGSEVLMRFPPEKAPVFAGVENASDLIAEQAIADIKAELGGVPAPKGLLEPGNIDLNARPVVKRPGGQIATVESTSVNLDGREVLLPTIADDGRKLTTDQAVDQFKKTGKHLGMFAKPDDATAYAKALSAAQGRQYGTEIDRAGLRLDPVPGGRTAQAFARGEPPPYIVSWEDKNGVVHMLNPGKVFVADPAAMKLRQSDRRRQGLDKERDVQAMQELDRSLRIPGQP